MLNLFNTLSRGKEELKPINKDWVGLYTCGPTVYNFAHIGNLRTYIFEDILQRTLEYNNYNVRRVMNITDVGHLTGDTDAGEDKLDREAQMQKKSVEEIARFYTDAFFADLEKLNVKKPDIIAPATKFIGEQISIIEILMQNGVAYDTPTAVYFDVTKFKDYGKLSGQLLKDKVVGAREEVIVDKEKHHPADFALWFKITGRFKNHLLHWSSPWGDGFPGWHIECSAISRRFLGQPFDIHTGGVDHIGTHHENETAQSEAAFGVPLAHIWMHGEHLLINDAKMAKSEGNFFTLADLEKRGYHPLVFRYLVLGAHYRTRINFSWESLEAARSGLNNLYQQIEHIYFLSKEIQEDPLLESSQMDNYAKYEKEFIAANNDDLNAAMALSVLQAMIHSSLSNSQKLDLIKKFDGILGLKLETPMQYSTEEKWEMFQKMEKYNQFRANQQFTHSDALRKEIEALGYIVRDTKDGSYIVKKFF